MITQETLYKGKYSFDSHLMSRLIGGAVIIVEGLGMDDSRGLLIRLTKEQTERTKDTKYPNGFKFEWFQTSKFNLNKKEYCHCGSFNMTLSEAKKSFHSKIWDR